MEEERLISLQNSSRGQKKLFEQYYKFLYQVALRYLSTREDAEDALVEAYIRIFNKISQFEYKGKGSLVSWMKRIVINESIRILEKKKRLYFLDELEEENCDIDVNIEGDIDLEQILSLLKKMPEGYRIVFQMYVIEGYAHKEISEILGVSVSTSKTQLMKARKYLMAKLIKQELYEIKRY